MKRLAACLSVAGLALLLAAPARAQFPGMDKIIKVAEAQRPWTASEEKAIGDATAAKLIAGFGLYEEPRAVKYVNLVGAAVAAQASRQDIDYRFGILDTEIVNAFATPGGYIFVTRGLLANLESEAELAGVLAHEVTHTADRHIEKELRSRKMGAIAVEAGAEQIPVGELARLADQATNQLLTGKFSRDKENDADTGGVVLAAAAGYDPRAYTEFIAFLGQASAEAGNKQAVGNLTASHPKYSDRVKRLEDLIAKRGWDKEERPRLAERYEANIQFGESAAPATETPPSAAASKAPTPGAAPASGSGGSRAESAPGSGRAGAAPGGLVFRPFSADQITTTEGKRQKAKVYVSQAAIRMESEERGEKSIAIMRWDRNLLWSLMPAQQMYMELPLNLGADFSRLAQDPKAKVDRELLGAELVGSYHCQKYRVRVTYEGRVYTGFEWAAQELDGFAVKRSDEKGTHIIEYENINFSPPDPALFEIPPGYRKVAL